jgi:hypothetical protein
MADTPLMNGKSAPVIGGTGGIATATAVEPAALARESALGDPSAPALSQTRPFRLQMSAHPSGRTVRPPARSRLLRAYGAMVSPRLRAWIKARLSTRTRAFLADRLTRPGPIARLGDLVLELPVRARSARFLRQPGYVLAHTGGGVAVARVVVDATALYARRANLNAVIDALDRAGVPYFCVRGFHQLASTVAVPESARPAVLSALRDVGREAPAYLAEVVRNRPGPMRPADARTLRLLQRATVIRFVLFWADPSGGLVLGRGSGCDVEFWSEQDGTLLAPRPNRAADSVAVGSPVVDLGEPAFTAMVAATSPDAPRYRTRPEMVGPLLDDVTFPIDVVYTWVDGDDPAWQRKRDGALGILTEVLNSQSANQSRFVNRDELRYSLRSLAMFAPWVRRIFLVTDAQVPDWLDVGHAQVTLVDHKQLFAGRGELPTFNSHAIESQLHHIDGLAEHFLYLNDDVFLGRPVPPQKFFHSNGLAKIYPSRAKIDFGPVDVIHDIPATAAGKNNRRIILKEFGRRVTYKMKHVPHAMLRSVLVEMEGKFPAEMASTPTHQFRHPSDISLTSSLYQYYATLSGRATPAEIRYLYADLAAAGTPALLRLLLAKRGYDVYCLNDTDSDPGSFARQHLLMRDFLAAYFPVPSPWERPGA